MAFYSRKHYQLLNPPPDSPGAVEERIRYRAAAEQAVREREERWPVLDATNAQEAINWQEKRIKELIESA